MGTRSGYSIRINFATYAARESELDNVCILARSLRDFGGRHAESAVRVYVPQALALKAGPFRDRLEALRIELTPVEDVGDAAAWYHYAQKVFSAARAEADCVAGGETLAWLDEDTVILQEPEEFDLPPGINLGYRPVMHRNIGLRMDEPIDAFWARVYANLSVAPDTLFPMVTPADDEMIRPFFNAGCLVVRPERGLLRYWAACWRKLYRDPELKQRCETDIRKRIFLHQAALTGAVLNHLEPGERLELSPHINYPIFFKEMFGGAHDFDDLTDVTTFRHESYFRDPAPDWEERLKGPPDRIDWIREHIATKPG